MVVNEEIARAVAVKIHSGRPYRRALGSKIEKSIHVCSPMRIVDHQTCSSAEADIGTETDRIEIAARYRWTDHSQCTSRRGGPDADVPVL